MKIDVSKQGLITVSRARVTGVTVSGALLFSSGDGHLRIEVDRKSLRVLEAMLINDREMRKKTR